MVATHPNLLNASEAADRAFRLQPRRVSAALTGESLRHDDAATDVTVASQKQVTDYRLRKHADYQRVYREGRKQFSSSMSYFYAVRGSAGAGELLAGLRGPRVGLTAGKVLGKAVERNRMKRRMRDIVRRRVTIVSANVDIVLHPRRSVLTADFAKLEGEVARIFSTIQSAIDKTSGNKTSGNLPVSSTVAESKVQS